MKWLSVLRLVLAVASPVMILCGIAWLLAYRRRCPRCGKHSLRMAGGYVRDRRGIPDGRDGAEVGGWAVFYLCKRCGAHLKEERGKTLLDASDEEWMQWVH
jgi:hypothetical protein